MVWKEAIVSNSNVMYTLLSEDTEEDHEKPYLRQLQSKLEFKSRDSQFYSEIYNWTQNLTKDSNLFYTDYVYGSLVREVGIATGYGMGCRGVGFRVQALRSDRFWGSSSLLSNA
jgi:hypothetical protein